MIKRSVPKVDEYTELGRPRSRVDMDGEYQRLLNRDRNPFAFLYNGTQGVIAHQLNSFIERRQGFVVAGARIYPLTFMRSSALL